MRLPDDGAPAPGAAAWVVAVNVTEEPSFDGFALEVSVVAVGVWLMVSFSAALVLNAYVASPL